MCVLCKSFKPIVIWHFNLWNHFSSWEENQVLWIWPSLFVLAINDKIFFTIQMASFSSYLLHGPNKLECLYLANLSNCNIKLAYRAIFLAQKKIKCWEYGPSLFVPAISDKEKKLFFSIELTSFSSYLLPGPNKLECLYKL
jgi:hypothetical protein